MKTIQPYIIFVLLLVISVVCVRNLYELQKQSLVISLPSISQISSSVAETASLEFKALTADYVTLHILTFMGEKVMKEEKTTDEEWNAIQKAFLTASKLDPRAIDPFLLATTTLPWEAGMVEETNQILLNAAKNRPNDYRPYFFLWYNHFHFLQDTENAAEYLKKAASIPGAPKHLQPLVTKMQLYSGRIEASIAYTLNIIETTPDVSMRNYMLKRLDALKKIHFLESAIRQFTQKFDFKPQHLQELVVTKIIQDIPQDPYGGDFFINEAGRVYTTSKLVNVTN